VDLPEEETCVEGSDGKQCDSEGAERCRSIWRAEASRVRASRSVSPKRQNRREGSREVSISHRGERALIRASSVARMRAQEPPRVSKRTA